MAWLGKQPINVAFRITASFKDAAGPVTGAAPRITIYDPTNAAVVVSQLMTQIGVGIYYYDYTPLLVGVYKVHTALAANSLWGYGSFEGFDIGRMP
jgi:hypothetical protein